MLLCAEKIKELSKTRFENEVGRKFFGKVMAKKKARLQQEHQTQDSAKKGDSQEDQPLTKEISSSASSEPLSTPASVGSGFASSSGIGGGGSSITSTIGGASSDNHGLSSSLTIPDKGTLVPLSANKIENELVPPPPPRADKWVQTHNLLSNRYSRSSHYFSVISYPSHFYYLFDESTIIAYFFNSVILSYQK